MFLWGRFLPEDSTDQLADHLRTVHFSITVLSLGLLFATFFAGSSQIDEALLQLRQITYVVQTMDPSWVDKYFDRIATDNDTKSGVLELFPKAIDIEGISRPVAVKLDVDPQWRLQKDDDLNKGIAEIKDVHFRSMSLVSFRQFWDGLEDAKQVVYPAELFDKLIVSVKIQDALKPEFRNWSRSTQAKTTGTLTVRYLDCDRESLKKSHVIVPDATPLFQCIFGGDLNLSNGPPDPFAYFRGKQPPAKDSEIISVSFLVTDVGTIQVIPQRELQRLYATPSIPLNWKLGTFDYTFHELGDLTSEFQDLTLEKIEAILRGQKDKSTENVEVAGIKVPASALRSGGALLLLGMQVYFLLHLRELLKRITKRSKAWNVAWIGLYSGLFAQSVTIFSASALPTTTVSFLANLPHPAGSRWLFAFYFSLPFISLTLSVLCLLTLWRIKGKQFSIFDEATT